MVPTWFLKNKPRGELFFGGRSGRATWFVYEKPRGELFFVGQKGRWSSFLVGQDLSCCNVGALSGAPTLQQLNCFL